MMTKWCSIETIHLFINSKNRNSICVLLQVKELLGFVQPAHISKPILKAQLSSKQWDSVGYINNTLQLEYEYRKKMLLQRLDVTFLSFQWSDRVKVIIVLQSLLSLLKSPASISS